MSTIIFCKSYVINITNYILQITIKWLWMHGLQVRTCQCITHQHIFINIIIITNYVFHQHLHYQILTSIQSTSHNSTSYNSPKESSWKSSLIFNTLKKHCRSKFIFHNKDGLLSTPWYSSYQTPKNHHFIPISS